MKMLPTERLSRNELDVSNIPAAVCFSTGAAVNQVWHRVPSDENLSRLDFILAEEETFPIWYPELWLFAQLTGSFGSHRFRIRLVDVTDPTVMPTMAPQ